MEHRYEMVRLSREKGLSERQIAKALGVPPATVHYWLVRDGKAGSENQKGRPRVTDSVVDCDLFLMSVNHPFKSAIDLKTELELSCSVDTVRRRLREKGLKCRVPARKPFLRQGHLQKRFQFASNHLHWTREEWHRVVFSDEKIFRSSTRGPLRVYRPVRGGDRFDPKYLVPSTNEEGGRHTIAVWMAFGGNGLVRQLHRIERRTLNSEYYTESILPLIEDTLVENELLFMHDCSSIHTSRETQRWVNGHNIVVMEDWPPKGPDMNPVENVWAELVRRTRPGSANVDELWENVQEAFHQLDDWYFTKLVESMPKRMKSVHSKRATRYFQVTNGITLRSLNLHFLMQVLKELNLTWNETKLILNTHTVVHEEWIEALLPHANEDGRQVLVQGIVPTDKLVKILKRSGNHPETEKMLAVDGLRGRGNSRFEYKHYIDNLTIPDAQSDSSDERHVRGVRRVYDELIGKVSDPARCVYTVMRKIGKMVEWKLPPIDTDEPLEDEQMKHLMNVYLKNVKQEDLKEWSRNNVWVKREEERVTE